LVHCKFHFPSLSPLPRHSDRCVTQDTQRRLASRAACTAYEDPGPCCSEHCLPSTVPLPHGRQQHHVQSPAALTIQSSSGQQGAAIQQRDVCSWLLRCSSDMRAGSAADRRRGAAAADALQRRPCGHAKDMRSRHVCLLRHPSSLVLRCVERACCDAAP
jgi:hypothetical protein